ncbi:hypothetical protein G7Y41_07020 [Schaalia sp. ZJ405]|uniref:hypothetical protein n=1 Tax=Schaalia sp. ZJ405 TaxID=2709403 RepID=UPI0013ED1E5A|nr:hypothetical protein [Schaalia sp. ZJ405]QPK80806.1 hypothetical protein G7Y41_07020 [Schaalia sp. ZJ405]
MKIKLQLTLGFTITPNTTEPEIQPQPTGSEALVEHANHDSTPRILGFTANPEPSPTWDDE